MADDLLVLTASEAGADIAPKSWRRSKSCGDPVGLSTMAQPEFLGNAIVAKERRPVIDQKLAYAICNLLRGTGHVFRRVLTAEAKALRLKWALMCLVTYFTGSDFDDRISSNHDRHCKLSVE